MPKTRLGRTKLGIPVTGYQQLSVSSTATSLTIPEGAKACVINIEDNDVRWQTDGTPTASVGMPVASGTDFQLFGAETLAGFKVISQTGTAKVNVSYFKV